MCGAEQAVLRSLFGDAESLSNGAQTHSLKMAHLEHNAFPRRQFRQYFLNARIHFGAFKAAFGVDIGAFFRDELQAVNFSQFAFEAGRFFLPDFSFAQLVEAEVGDDTVQPGGETAIEAELGQVAIDAEKGLLIDIAGVFFGAQQIVGHAQNLMVVRPHKFVKRARIAALCGANQVGLGGTFRCGLHAYIVNKTNSRFHHKTIDARSLNW